jgi:hypothetical protein
MAFKLLKKFDGRRRENVFTAARLGASSTILALIPYIKSS